MPASLSACSLGINTMPRAHSGQRDRPHRNARLQSSAPWRTQEAGPVPELRVENGSDIRVLFLEGEQLVGAKQNRILNISRRHSWA
jgi:hypothetical protein